MPCNPIDFLMPGGNEGNFEPFKPETDIFELEKKYLAENKIANQLLTQAGEFYSDHKNYQHSLNEIISAGYSIIDQVALEIEFAALQTNLNESSKKQFILKIEEGLCIKRHEILQLRKLLPDGGFMNSALIDEVKKLHINHREEDRKHWLHWLYNRREILIKLRDAGHDEEVIRILGAVQKEIERVREISQKILIQDRKLFGRNDQAFLLEREK